MPIPDRVSEAMKEALRARDQPRVLALRSVRAAFVNEMKRDGSDSLSDERCVAILRTLAKQRRESIEAFERAGRAERADAERAELALIETFLPSLADEDLTRAWVDAAISETGAAGPGDLGRVMGAVMKAHRGEVDGALARRIATERLGG